jgi:hypothetical protein
VVTFAGVFDQGALDDAAGRGWIGSAGSWLTGQGRFQGTVSQLKLVADEVHAGAPDFSFGTARSPASLQARCCGQRKRSPRTSASAGQSRRCRHPQSSAWASAATGDGSTVSLLCGRSRQSTPVSRELPVWRGERLLSRPGRMAGEGRELPSIFSRAEGEIRREMRLSATKRRHAGMNGESPPRDDEIELAVRAAIRAFHRKSLAPWFAAA